LAAGGNAGNNTQQSDRSDQFFHGILFHTWNDNGGLTRRTALGIPLGKLTCSVYIAKSKACQGHQKEIPQNYSNTGDKNVTLYWHEGGAL
jgi:hypothetical protein